MQVNPKDTNAFARVGLICGRFRDMAADDTIAAVAAADGTTSRLTYGDLRMLLSEAYEAGDRLQRIVAWHARETGPGGLVGDYCTECGNRWPCDTRRMAEGTYVDPDESPTEEEKPLMTKGEAVATVANWVAGLIEAGDLEEATGFTQPERERMSPADRDRLYWAMGEVARRLHRMGTSTE